MCAPTLACSVFSFEVKASNNARPDGRGMCSSSHWSANSIGMVVCFAASAREACPNRPKLEGVQRRPPFRHGALREVGVVPGDDRAFRLAGRPRPVQLGDLPLVLRRARTATVAGRVDGGDAETAAGHKEVRAARHRRGLLVRAAAVAHQHQRCAAGAGFGRPQHAGDLAHGEVAFADTVRRCLRSEMHGGAPFGIALVSRRSRRHLRQSPGREGERSTHVDTAFTGLTSSIGFTAYANYRQASSRPTDFHRLPAVPAMPTGRVLRRWRLSSRDGKRDGPRWDRPSQLHEVVRAVDLIRSPCRRRRACRPPGPRSSRASRR